MNKLKWVNITLAVFTFVTCHSSAAVENRLVRCASYLIASNAYHQTPSLSRRYTFAALAKLNLFRTVDLKGFDHQASNRSVTANQSAFQSEKQSVAQRITGIMTDRRGNIEAEDDEAQKQVLLATAFSGREDILAELDRRIELAQQIHHDNRGVLGSVNGANVIHDIVGAGAAGVLSATPGWVSQGHLLGGALAAFFGWANRTYLEMAIRGLGLYNWSSRVEEKFKSALDDLKPGKWEYASSDEKLPLAEMNEIRKMAEVRKEHLAKFLGWQVYPSTTIDLTGTTLINDPKLRDYEPGASGWARTDEVLFWDPIDNKPQLIVVLRVVEKLPMYPKTAPNLPSSIRSSSSRTADRLGASGGI